MERDTFANDVASDNEDTININPVLSHVFAGKNNIDCGVND